MCRMPLIQHSDASAQHLFCSEVPLVSRLEGCSGLAVVTRVVENGVYWDGSRRLSPQCSGAGTLTAHILLLCDVVLA